MEPSLLPAVTRARDHQAAFHLHPRRLVRDLVFVMGGLAVLVVLLDLWLYSAAAVATPYLRTLFDAQSETGLGSWLAVSQAVLIAATLWLLTSAYRHGGASRLRQGGWALLAVFFTYLAFDDGTQLHERIGTAFADAHATGLQAGFPSFAWQVLFGPFFAGMALFIGLFLWKELRTPRLKALTAAALALLALAVAMDFVEGLDADHPLNVYAHLAAGGNLDDHAQVFFRMNGLDAVTHVAQAIEESIEMVAMTLLWAVFLLHFADTVDGVRLSWTHAEAEGTGSAPARPACPSLTVRA